MRGIPLCVLVLGAGGASILLSGLLLLALTAAHAGSLGGGIAHSNGLFPETVPLLSAEGQAMTAAGSWGVGGDGLAFLPMFLISAAVALLMLGAFTVWLQRQVVASLQEVVHAMEAGRSTRLRSGGRVVRELRLLEERYNRSRTLIDQRLRELDELAYRDQLTGATNRRGLEEALALELERAERTGSGPAVIYLDLDGFKEVNDRWGHPRGDAFLRQVAEFLQARTRSADTLARWGGDEFVVLCRDTDRTGAEVVARALECRLLRCEIEPGVRCGASIGVAGWRPGDSVNSLLARADQAMYAAKWGEGDRVIAG